MSVDAEGAHTVKFIEAVQRSRILYDVGHIFSKDVQRKNKAWRDIALETGLDNARAAKLKWRNLKNNYQKHKKSIENTTDLTYKKYKNWPWADQMDFLNGHNINRNTPGSVCTEFYDMNTQPDHGQSVKVPADGITPIVLKKRKTVDTQNNQAGKMIQHLENRKEESTLDYVDHLFLYYSNICKKMPPRTQIELKLKMAQMFAEAEVNELTTQETNEEVSTMPNWSNQTFKEESDYDNDTS